MYPLADAYNLVPVLIDPFTDLDLKLHYLADGSEEVPLRHFSSLP